MDMPTPGVQTETEPAPLPQAPKSRAPRPSRLPAVIAFVVATAIAALSVWYLVRGEPLLVQGEVDATRFDIAARVDGRVGEIPVARGENVAANAVLVRIDNPETVAKHEQALAAKIVADAQLANIKAGTRPEVIAARKAALDRTQARLDQATDALHESQRAQDQAKSAHEQAVNGYTAEEHQIAAANVEKAVADIKA